MVEGSLLVTTADIEDVLALSPLQLGLYSHATLIGPDVEDPYVIAMTANVSGPLDVALLRDCASAMLVRHPNLRASFWHQDLPHPVQIVPSSVELPWQQVSAADDDEAATLEQRERSRPFTLHDGPLIRFLLIGLPEQRWRLVVTAHHIVIDGWSLPVFIGEMLTLYRGGGDPDVLPQPRLYRDYIGWLAGRDPQVGEQIWRKHLAGMPGPTLLSPALGGEGTGLPKRTELVLPAADAEDLAAAARSRGVTLNTLLQMAWALILSRLTDRDDVVFGVTVSGRPPELAGVETMVGLFINTIPLRVHLNPNATVAQHCSALQREAAELRDHSHLTHSQLRTFAGVGEMFDTLLVFESFPPGDVVGGGEFMAGQVGFRPAAMESLTHFPVTIAAYRSDAELTLLVEVTDNALGAMSPELMGARVLTIMRRLIEMWDRPLGAVAILLDGEARQAGQSHTPAAAGRGVGERFAEAAAVQGDSVALCWEGGQLSYSELHERSDRLAGLLAQSGVRGETAVAIQLPRGADYVVAMLGVLKAGGMYVPLEPSMPAGRVESILTQTDAALVIDEDTMAAARTAPRFSTPTAPDQAAYAVFTSGTTGEPKGVIGTHRALLAYVDDHGERMLRPAAERLGRRLRIGHAWSFAFDAAWQPLAGLLFGHTVHLIDEIDRRDAEALVDIIDRRGIDMLDVTPSLFTNLRRAGLLDRGLLSVLALGGEAVGAVDWTDIRKACTQTLLAAHNCYGPTETTVEAVVAAIADHDSPVIGYPTRSTGAVVLDSWLQPVPDGVVGELYLAGEQVTRGYLGRPTETATRFVAAPGGGRMYRTGDLVRRDRDGALSFIGRADAQIQVRGYRVEPGEIEAVLEEVPGVRHVHVAVHRQVNGPRLIAYVAGEVTAPDLRSLLRNRLPRYMMPHRLIVVDVIPLTANGKVDEVALAASASPDEAPEFPATPTEIALGRAVAELLGLTEVDIDADLLELGLDSIVALSLVQAARRDGLPLRARLVLECGTLRELAAAMDRDTDDDLAAGPEPEGPIPALPAVHWLFEHGDPRRMAQIEAITLPSDVTAGRLRGLLDGIAAGHEMFRSRLDVETMTFLPADRQSIPLTEVEVDGELGDAITEHAASAIDRLDPASGNLAEALWLHRSGDAGVLVFAVHVLAMDPASWRIVLGELTANWPTPDAQLVGGERVSYRRWAHQLADRAADLDTIDFWLAQLDGEDPALGARRIRPRVDRFGDLAITITVTETDVTDALVRAQAPIQDLLADACARLISRWREQRGHAASTPLLALETHGRSDDADDTVGLLSAIYPLRITPGEPIPEIIGQPTDYAVLRYLRADTRERLNGFRGPQVLLNYLGRLDLDAGSLLDRSLLADVPIMTEPNVAVRHELTLVAAVAGGKLVTQWRTLPDIFSDADIAALQEIWQTVLTEVTR